VVFPPDDLVLILEGVVVANFWRNKVLTKENIRGLVIALIITALLFIVGVPPE
jgi:hypothetical protein